MAYFNVTTSNGTGVPPGESFLAAFTKLNLRFVSSTHTNVGYGAGEQAVVCLRLGTRATGDYPGGYYWRAGNDVGTEKDYAREIVQITDASAGTEDATIFREVIKAGTLTKIDEYLSTIDARVFYSGGSERVRIDSAGNVGLGTSSPEDKLDVNGTIISRGQSPAIALLGDIDGAKGLIKLGGNQVTFCTDSTDTASLGTGDVTYKGRTYRPKFAINPDGSIISAGPIKPPSYTVGTVPAAGSHTGAIVYVSDETGGAIPAFSDGTNWRRMTDRAVIS